VFIFQLPAITGRLIRPPPKGLNTHHRPVLTGQWVGGFEDKSEYPSPEAP